jgi:hypothetical protein
LLGSPHGGPIRFSFHEDFFFVIVFALCTCAGNRNGCWIRIYWICIETCPGIKAGGARPSGILRIIAPTDAFMLGPGSKKLHDPGQKGQDEYRYRAAVRGC